MKTFKYILGFALLNLLFATTGFGQCKEFTKQNCLENLRPYIYNGQFNSVVLSENDIAELLLTFYSGQDYRIYVCAEDAVGDIHFRVFDDNRELIFDNMEHGAVTNWDFTAKTTHQLIVEVGVPYSPDDNMENRGCVTIMVGFKESTSY